MKQATLATLFAAALSLSTMSAHAVQLVTNGGFETGTLAGWSNSGLGASGTCPSGNRDWNASNNAGATGCNAPSNPSGSTYAAYVMNDGTGPLTYKLTQNIFVPIGTVSGVLSFDWTSTNSSDAGRTFSAWFNGVNIFSSSTSGSFNWSSLSFDISTLLASSAGSNAVLEFDNFVPQTWSGPAGLGLDNVGINAQIPEPSSLALLGAGLLGLMARRRKVS